MNDNMNNNDGINNNVPQPVNYDIQNGQTEGFTNYYQQADTQPQITQQSGANEVAYYPVEDTSGKKKKKRGKKIAKVIAAIVCVLVISFGSIAGYIALADNGVRIPFLTSDSDSDKKSDDSSTADKNKTDSEADSIGHQSLLQMAAKENALTIPQIVDKVSPSVVGISCKISGSSGTGVGTGTGIIMTQDGYIITNGHVVEDATEITVVIASKDNKLDEVKAKLIGLDAQTDLAVVKIEKTGLIPAEFGKSSDLQVGELAIAFGNPLGFELAGSVTGGIISALNRELTIEDKQLTLIQTDAAINPGNSGGPLVNSYGQVIGINSAKISSSYAEGLGFAIPIDEAKPIIDNLIQYGYVKGRPMLGVSGEEITDVVARYYNLPQGIVVRFIDPKSGAEKAGIKLGDIITAIDDKPVQTMNELNTVKESHKAGEKVKLTVYREGKNIDIDVELMEATK